MPRLGPWVSASPAAPPRGLRPAALLHGVKGNGPAGRPRARRLPNRGDGGKPPPPKAAPGTLKPTTPQPHNPSNLSHSSRPRNPATPQNLAPSTPQTGPGACPSPPPTCTSAQSCPGGWWESPPPPGRGCGGRTPPWRGRGSPPRGGAAPRGGCRRWRWCCGFGGGVRRESGVCAVVKRAVWGGGQDVPAKGSWAAWGLRASKDTPFEPPPCPQPPPLHSKHPHSHPANPPTPPTACPGRG